MDVMVTMRDGRTVSHSFPVPAGVDENRFHQVSETSTTRHSGDYVTEIVEELAPCDAGWVYRRTAEFHYGEEATLEEVYDHGSTRIEVHDRRAFPAAPSYEIAARVVVPRSAMPSVRLIIANGVTVYDCDEEVMSDDA